jgi:hypothetical protein
LDAAKSASRCICWLVELGKKESGRVEMIGGDSVSVHLTQPESSVPA